MPTAQDDDLIVGHVDNTAASYVLLDPDRYCFTLSGLKIVPNNFYKEGQVEIGPDGKEKRQAREQFQVTFRVSAPDAPDDYFVDEQNQEIQHIEWYGKRDDGKLTPKMRTSRLFAALLGATELPDGANLSRSSLIGKKMIAVIAHRTSQDGKTVRAKISKDTEMPFVVGGPKKFGARKAAPAQATADESGDAPF